MKKIVINIFKVKFLLVISLMSFLIIMDLKVAFSADYYQNYDEFYTQISNPTLINFENIVSSDENFKYYGNPGTMQLSGINFNSNGALFIQNTGSNSFLSIQQATTENTLELFFPSNTYAVSFNFISADPVTVQLSFGQINQTFNIGNSPYPNYSFAGFISETPIERIYYSVGEGADFDDFLLAEELSEVLDETPIPCMVDGTILDAVTEDAIPGATLVFTSSEFNEEYQSNPDGTFNITDIPAGTYQVVISAEGYQLDTYENLTLTSDTPQSLTISLEQNRPEITGAGPEKAQISNNQDTSVTFYADISDPDGITDVDSVTLNLSDISTDLGVQAMSLTDEEAGRFEAAINIPAGTAPRLYSVSVTATDSLGYTDVKIIEFEVTRKSVETIAPNQTTTQKVDNPIDNQSLEIYIQAGETSRKRTGGSIRASVEDCYVEVRVYQPDGELYESPYQVYDYLDIVIENAMKGQWTYETINYCAESIDVEIETRGANTGILTGTVKDSITRAGVENAQVEWSLGGNAMTDEQGFFSIVAVAGSCALVTSADDYQIRLRADVSLSSGKTTTLAIELIPEVFEALPVPESQLTEKILNPASKADYLNQPLAAVVEDGNLTISTCFAPYQEPVNIYLGITLDHPDLASYFLLFNSDDQLNFLTDTLFPWREMASDWNEVELFSIPVTALPKATYTFYLLVTDDPDAFSRYDFRFFSIQI